MNNNQKKKKKNPLGFWSHIYIYQEKYHDWLVMSATCTWMEWMERNDLFPVRNLSFED